MAGRLALLVVAATVAGCQFDRSSSGRPPDGGPADAAADSGPLPDGTTGGATHILIREVKPAPDTLEFIEIYNPTCHDLSLATYFLTDMPSYPLLPSWGGIS